MIEDVRTVLWKEWRELLQQRDSARGTLISLLVPAVVMGVLVPWQSGAKWLTSPASLAAFGWLPLVLVATVIAEVFAGERERHTLETLLASRLSDRAILFGKIAGAALYGWGTALAVALLGLLTVNLGHWDGAVRLYTPLVALGGVGIALLTALFTAAGGCLISLRAATVRQAQQTMGLMTLLPVLPVLALNVVAAATRRRLLDAVVNTSALTAVLICAAVLAALDVALVLAALARFQRAKLVLD